MLSLWMCNSLQNQQKANSLCTIRTAKTHPWMMHHYCEQAELKCAEQNNRVCTQNENDPVAKEPVSVCTVCVQLKVEPANSSSMQSVVTAAACAAVKVQVYWMYVLT